MVTKQDFYGQLSHQLRELDQLGFPAERPLNSPQGPEIVLADGRRFVNLNSSNYLGLAANPEVVAAAKAGLDQWGFGIASARIFCGTQVVHHTLEKKISEFLHTEESILYNSCFDVNLGLFEALLSPEDAIIWDSHIHASSVDGIHLCPSKSFPYESNDMVSLKKALIQAEEAGARFKMIATDGVFSMDGIVADLKTICDLADHYQAIVMVDDSHATGVVGKTGRGSHEYCGVMDRVDVITSTLSKALGGASGGFASGRKEIIRTLRHLSHTSMSSNALTPVIAATAIKVIDMISQSNELQRRAVDGADYFRRQLRAAGFNALGQDIPIVPVILGEEKATMEMGRRIYERGVFITGIIFPFQPMGMGMVRTQITAGHTREHLDRAITIFTEVGKGLGIIK